MIRQIRQRRQQARQVTDTEKRRGTHKTCKKNKTLGARGRKKTKASATRNASAEALEQSAEWALIDGGKEGGERGEREWESTARKGTHKYTTRAHADTINAREEEGILKGGILRSSKAAVRIFVRGGWGSTHTISGVPCTAR